MHRSTEAIAHDLHRDGFAVLPFDAAVAAWADAARVAALRVLSENTERRHGGTWFVGVDALPNAEDGSIGDVPLAGAWRHHVTTPRVWHRAQLSVVFPGYPQQDPDESDTAYRFRRDRDAAHIDGLLPEGPSKRRHLREPHGFILGVPLNDVSASPLVVWPGSHHLIHTAFARAFASCHPDTWPDQDVTEIYQDVRRLVFAECRRVAVRAQPGEAIVLHRHLVHGVAPWGDSNERRPRMVAYFRPLVPFADWL
ncbi:MAG: hypothetical protein AAFP85_14630 [Pseudomonadota bacterium]